MKTPSLSRRRFIRQAGAALAATPFIVRGAERVGFEIGLVADAQYADVEAKGTRFYRQSLAKLEAAVEHCNGRDLAFCVHLGDLIDREWRSFDEITRPLARRRQRWQHLLGNHDFEVAEELKAGVPERMGMAWRYGAFTEGDFRFLVLDTNEVSTYATVSGTTARTEAEATLARFAAAKVRQAKPWNGALGTAQLTWLERECSAARAARQKVIILAHHPVYPENEHNAWNASEILAVIDRHPHVVAWLNGHNHAGAYGVRNGVHFLTMKGMVETADTTAFATARILADRIVLTGHGREPSREMVFRA